MKGCCCGWKPTPSSGSNPTDITAWMTSAKNSWARNAPRRFSSQRMKDAIADSVTKRQIEFLVLEGDSFRAFTVPYADGPKYLELVRDTSKPDILMAILKPVAQAEK